MPISPATVATVVGIGVKLYEFIDKVTNKGQKGDALQPIMSELHAIRGDINRMGEDLKVALDNVADQIVGDIRLTQLAQLPDAHAAIADYLRTHPNPPTPPQVNDPNYVVARGKTSDVTTYFLNHSELSFMGGFVYAMNTRIEFMTALDICPFAHNPEYVGQIRAGVNQLNSYIARVNAGVDKQFHLSEKENFHFEQSDEPPFGKPVKVIDSITFKVTGMGQVFFDQTVPPEQRAATRSKAQNARNQAAGQQKSQLMGPYQQIAATWNGLVATQSAIGIRATLLPGVAVDAVPLPSPTFEVTSLRELPAPAGVRAADAEPRYALPLRDLLVDVLDSPVFQQRQLLALATGNEHLVRFWVQKAFRRAPTAAETETLAAVLTLFGPKSFFHALSYSSEYEDRWGDGLPEIIDADGASVLPALPELVDSAVGA